MQTRIAVIFATSDGQTHKIAGNIAALLQERGVDVDVVNGHVMQPDFPFDEYDGIILGGSIHTGEDAARLEEVIVNQCDAWEDMPTAFFAVSPTHSGVSAAESEEDADDYIEDVLHYSGWMPAYIGLFTGGLRYVQYGFVKRRMADGEYRRMDTSSLEGFSYPFLRMILELKDPGELSVNELL